MGKGREWEWTSMFKFHTFLNLWLKNHNSNINFPQAENEFDKVNFEKMNSLPTLSCALVWYELHVEYVLSNPCCSLTAYSNNNYLLNYMNQKHPICQQYILTLCPCCERDHCLLCIAEWWSVFKPRAGIVSVLCCWDIDKFTERSKP